MIPKNTRFGPYPGKPTSVKENALQHAAGGMVSNGMGRSAFSQRHFKYIYIYIYI